MKVIEDIEGTQWSNEMQGQYWLYVRCYQQVFHKASSSSYLLPLALLSLSLCNTRISLLPSPTCPHTFPPAWCLCLSSPRFFFLLLLRFVNLSLTVFLHSPYLLLHLFFLVLFFLCFRPLFRTLHLSLFSISQFISCSPVPHIHSMLTSSKTER